MKKTYIGYSVLAAVLALSAQQANAQQGFGTDKPSKASVVEMTSGSKGLLIPRVALTSLDSFAPVSGEAPTDVDKTDALLVYNTATSDDAVADEEKVTPVITTGQPTVPQANGTASHQMQISLPNLGKSKTWTLKPPTMQTTSTNKVK